MTMEHDQQTIESRVPAETTALELQIVESAAPSAEIPCDELQKWDWNRLEELGLSHLDAGAVKAQLDAIASPDTNAFTLLAKANCAINFLKPISANAAVASLLAALRQYTVTFPKQRSGSSSKGKRRGREASASESPATRDAKDMSVPLVDIVVDPEIQIRAVMDPETVTEYAEAMTAGDRFPPVTVFRDANGAMLLADGFHRVAAAGEAGLTAIHALVKAGGRRDALLHAVGANATHGLRRTNADKRRAVEMLVGDEEWGQWSSRRIADRCGVSHFLVGRVRDDACASGRECQMSRQVRRGDQVYTMDIGDIGGGPKVSSDDTLAFAPPETLRDDRHAEAEAASHDHISSEETHPADDIVDREPSLVGDAVLAADRLDQPDEQGTKRPVARRAGEGERIIRMVLEVLAQDLDRSARECPREIGLRLQTEQPDLYDRVIELFKDNDDRQPDLAIAS